MALINCPNCGREVSDRAVKCPSCGADIQALVKEATAPAQSDIKPVEVRSADEANVDTHLDKVNPSEAADATAEGKSQESQKAAEEAAGTDAVAEEKTEETEYPEQSPNRKWIWALVVSLIIILAGCGVGGYFYYQNVYLPEKIDREAPRTYPIVNVFVRSSKDSGGDFNKVGLVPYGGELITYEQGNEWSRVKYIPVDPTQHTLEGYVSSFYLLSKSDFDLLNGIFGNDEARQVIGSAKCRRALLSYYKDNGLIGKAREGDYAHPIPTGENQWQIFLSSATEKPNEVYFKRILNPDSKFTDFAVVMKNTANNKGRLVYFSFEDDEAPHLVAEYELPSAGKITEISLNPYRPDNLDIYTTVGTPYKVGGKPSGEYVYE